MDIKEVIETLKHWIEARHLFSSFHRKDLEGFLAFIKSQQERLDTQKDEIAKLVIDVNRLSELEEKCPDCDNGTRPCEGIQDVSSKPCPTCSGSGKVPICYLPDRVVKAFNEAHSIQFSDERGYYYETIKSGMRIPHIELGRITKQPNNYWKLEQITSLDKEKL